MLGRLLQMIGMLIVPPVAILAQLNETISLGQMLVMAIFGVCAFYVGRLVEGYAIRG